MNELKFIKYLQRTIRTGSGVVRGIGDDTAILKYTKDKYMLFASDMIIEGVHFKKGTEPFKIGWKAVAVNISDVAAMGGVPKYVVISVGVPKHGADNLLKGIMRGAQAISKRFGVIIAGGDTNSSKDITVDVAIIGEVEKDLAARRDKARPGDHIFVTGRLGEGKLKHLDFIPRIKEARVLVQKFKVKAMMDISDGLSLDLARMCEASRVGAKVYENKIPVSAKAKNFAEAVSYGEDFELLFTLPAEAGRRLLKYADKNLGFKVTCIGGITEKGKGLVIVDGLGKKRKMKVEGYQHFQSPRPAKY